MSPAAGWARVAFACPPDCGHCCTHLEREPAPGDDEFRAILRDEGIYHCPDSQRVGLSLSNAEAAVLRAAAKERGMRVDIHPRTYLLETRRRVAVVLAWHMPNVSCAFYADYKCTAYEVRPMQCRAFPVIGLGRGPDVLAPDCPKMPIPLVQLRAERKARDAMERAHAKLDELGWLLLARPDARYVKGLTPREAKKRLDHYRVVAAEEWASTPRTSSTT